MLKSNRHCPVSYRPHTVPKTSLKSRTGRAVRSMAHGQEHLWALDFDGVVCDSVGESSVTSWKAACRQWPEVFETKAAEASRKKVMDGMRICRPVIETGYENPVQTRCLLEGITPETILSDWHNILHQKMKEWKLERAQLVELFGSARDDWMKEDLHGWLNENGIYAGLPDMLQGAMQAHELYIVTTKQERFTEALLKDMAKVPLASDRIWSTTVTGKPKSDMLRKLQAKHPHKVYHFVEDKLGTLEKVIDDKELDHWKLYLVDWGYNTREERARATSNPRIQVVKRDQLAAAMKA
ncbi:hypothetical protein WJX84_009307 [Apatococcus fuscideae]|uniref:HAD family hydrolase n=1 Tax=Apatococcus fuscideae TaxID=2026836 RepID=A0AAW1THK1_9CHLO